MKNLFLRVFLLCYIFTGINCFAQTKALWVGETYKCDATISMFFSVSDIKWTVNNPSIELSGNNYVKTAKVAQYFSGTATVKCSWKENGKGNERTWSFSCYSNDVAIFPATLTLNVGETYRLGYSHKYDNESLHYARVTFSSSSTCVSVDNDGYVTALSPGTADVNVYSTISQLSPYCRVTIIGDNTPVIPPSNPSGNEPEEISFEKSSVSISKGFTFQQEVNLFPANSSTNIQYSSSNSWVATVDARTGFVKGIDIGEATITATSSNNLSCSYKVVVEKSVAGITMPMVAPLANKLNKIIENTMKYKK